MEHLYSGVKWLHILAGSSALVCGLFAIIFRNRIRLHKPFGRIYFWSMTVIFFSSLFMAGWKNSIFFICLSCFTYYSCLVAFRALRLKKLHAEQSPKWYDWGIEVFFGLMHLAFLAFGIYLLQSNMVFGIISSVFGLLGIRQNYDSINRLRKKITHKNYWLLAHIGGMLGSYIGAITAFLVNNNKWMHLPDLAVWLGPTFFLVPFLIYEIRKYKNQSSPLKA